MVLKIIDVSSWNSVETAAGQGVDGVIVKTTQGTHYVNPKADQQYQLAKKNGKLLGIYHYAEGTDPKAEAEYFYNNSKGYIKEAIPFLDWEAGENRSWGNPNWCRAFVDHFHALTGVWCGIYVQASAISQVANLSNTCPLWVAGYPTRNADWNVPKFNYNIDPWPTYTLWQFTDGGGLDRNVANLTPEAWRKIANPSGGAQPAPKPTPSPAPHPSGYTTNGKSLETMAGDTQNGLTGSGEARKNILGKYYTGVQAIVNERAKAISAPECHKILTKETLAGKYGNGAERVFLLGNYYAAIQQRINTGNY